jgi:hypothetical protein
VVSWGFPYHEQPGSYQRKVEQITQHLQIAKQNDDGKNIIKSALEKWKRGLGKLQTDKS